MDTFDRDKLHAQLTLHEGLRLKPYQDTEGIWTVGVGHNLNYGISHQAALIILNDDIDQTVQQVRALVQFFDRLSDGRQRALLDLAFQYGAAGLKTHFVTVLWQLERGCWDCAAHALEILPYAQEYKSRAADNIALLRQG